jgi:hypothetical protein
MAGDSLGRLLFDPVTSDDVLWLLTPSKETNDEVQVSFDRLSGQLARRLIVVRASPSADDPFPTLQWKDLFPPPQWEEEQLRAIVIVLEEDALRDNNFFKKGVEWCIEYVDKHDDISLFVCSTGLSRQEIVDLGAKLRKEGDDLLHRLLERVQVPNLPTPDHLSHFLKVQLSTNPSGYPAKSVESEPATGTTSGSSREAAGQGSAQPSEDRAGQIPRALPDGHPPEQSLSVRFTTLLGQLANLILLCCATATGIAAYTILILGKESIIARWIVANSVVTTTIAGITIFFLLSICVVLLRSMTVGSLLQAMSRNRGRLILLSFAGPTTVLLFLQIHVLPSDVALGIVIGILLDITRHNGYLAQRTRLSLDKFLNYSKEGEQQYSEELKQTQALLENTLFEYPFFPMIAPPTLSYPANRQTRNRNPFLYFFGTTLQIFISYTTEGSWSRFYARNLYNILNDRDISAFIDIRDIREGSTQWHNSLSRALAESNVFIAVLDEKSVTKPWVAAEMRAALESRSISGSPEIVVLLSPQLSAEVSEEMCPVFKALLQHRDIAEKKGWIHYIEANDSTAGGIYAQIERITGKDKISKEDEQYISKRVTEHLSEQILPDLRSHLGVGPSILGRPLTALLLSCQFMSRLIALISPILGFGLLIVAYLFRDDFLSFTSLFPWYVLAILYLICCYCLGYLARHSFAFSKKLFILFPIAGFVLIIYHFVQSIIVPISVLDWGIALCWIGWLVSGPVIQGEKKIEHLDPGFVKVEESKRLWQNIPDLTPYRWYGKINTNASRYRTDPRILEAKEKLYTAIDKYADTSNVNKVVASVNKALAIRELGLLYRATNEFEKARNAYEESHNTLKVLREWISKEWEHLDEYTKRQILDKYREEDLDEHTRRQILDKYRETVFRLAELDHVQGNYSSAKTGYEETLQIDELLGHDDREGEEWTKRLLQEVHG